MNATFRPLGLAAVAALVACAPPEREGAGEGGAEWLAGTVDERFQHVGDQLGGFSQTMMEVGYRYQELHWAVQDGNWEYASYQGEKIGDAIERGIERRPARGQSARETFLEGPLPELLGALEDGDPDLVHARLDRLRAACNACHVAEAMPFVMIEEPSVRTSAVRGQDGDR